MPALRVSIDNKENDMPITEVTMYRGTCGGPDCKAATSDDSDYWCWSSASQVVEEAQDGDWYVATTSDNTVVLFCPDHAPVCTCTGCEACKTYPDGNCKVRIRDDEFGTKCEDCFIESEESTDG